MMPSLKATLACAFIAHSVSLAVAQETLRERLRAAAEVLAAAKGIHTLQCKCEDYCVGRCFAAGCASCTASTWSFPGGGALCADPGPLGNGLLCREDAKGIVTGDACCGVGSPCALPAGSCCESGSCSSCPAYEKQTLFPPLDDVTTPDGLRRSFDNKTNACSLDKVSSTITV
eukprot:TRINITY_DN75711_c0_g1_i1.p1 TRINITY_DN75711_c0_g1~~TRINITY_DN75711_c0_g1_i1.p1  ORF type:complete len:173 (+),score=22.63 TRINITY_DN75711_c0_g1_i1:77-595(+)